MALSALLVSYAFPPVGGAGVQRVAKLVKYLPRWDVTPSVLTVKNPSVPLRDESLLFDLPPDLRVLRARTLEPGYAMKQATWATAAGPSGPTDTATSGGRLAAFGGRWKGHLGRAARQLLVPDAQLLWQPGAAAALLPELLRREAPDAVFISAPPFSQFLLSPLVRLAGRGRKKTALILDYRDEWSTYRTAYEMGQGGLGAALGGPLEERLLGLAHFVTTATPEFRENLLATFPFLDAGRVVAIANGYDPDDFPRTMPAPPTPGPDGRYVLAYAGTIFRLTSARGLLGAVRRLHERSPRLAALLELRFMGRIVETELDAFAGMEALGVRRLGYLDHRRVLEELAASHRTLCLLDEAPGVERIYPGKVFELMYLGRPALVLSPEGALTRLVRESGMGAVLPPRDEAQIAAFLEAELTAFSAGRAPPAPATRGMERYHRSALAGEIATVLRDAVSLARGGTCPRGPRAQPMRQNPGGEPRSATDLAPELGE